MKIRMSEMAPERKILNRGEVVNGETALEIVQGMMVKNLFASRQAETAYMGPTLARFENPFASRQAETAYMGPTLARFENPLIPPAERSLRGSRGLLSRFKGSRPEHRSKGRSSPRSPTSKCTWLKKTEMPLSYWGAAEPLCAKPVIPSLLSTASLPRPQRAITMIF